MNRCLCGCGRWLLGSRFALGHNGKLTRRLLRAARRDELVYIDAVWVSPMAYAQQVSPALATHLRFLLATTQKELT